MQESSSCQLSSFFFLQRTQSIVIFSLLLSANAMASVISLPVRWSRLKIINFNQLTRNFSTNPTINRRLSGRHPYWWYLLGGSVCAGVYLKWQQSPTVIAFNPKKFKVSLMQIKLLVLNRSQCCEVFFFFSRGFVSIN